MQTCKQCQKQFNIDAQDQVFYKKMNVPEPTLCPDCRRQRRFAFRNERALYSRPCDLCKKTVVSFYSVSYPGKVYCQDCWWSDAWDSKTYGRVYDPSKSFFEQFHELFLSVPQLALINTKSENAAFTAHSASNKNCYLLISAGFNEDCYYGFQIVESRDVMDSTFARQSEIGYELVDCDKMYNSRYCFKSEGCRDSAFLYDCHNCDNCFMSCNLRNKRYVYNNQQLTKEEYEKELSAYHISSFKTAETLKKDFAIMLKNDAVHRFSDQIKCEQSTGDHLLNCKNCVQCFDVRNAEDCKYIVVSPVAIFDCYDTNYAIQGELFCDVLSNIGAAMDQAFCQYSWASSRMQYCSYVMNSEDCFGCASAKKAKYCILNKQYTREEYEKLRGRIIEDMEARNEYGEFFLAALSPFGYNETIANDEWPLTREEANTRGWKWSDEARGVRGKETKQWSDMPDDTAQTDESVCNEMFECRACRKNYKIIKQEFLFYKRHGVALPRECFDCRHMARMRMRNPRKLWHRQCACSLYGHGHHADNQQCSNKFETTYAPERPEKVFCAECHLKETA